MPLWEWIAVTATAWFAFAVIIGFALAATLGRIARGGLTTAEYEALLETAAWADRPLEAERLTGGRMSSVAFKVRGAR